MHGSGQEVSSLNTEAGSASFDAFYRREFEAAVRLAWLLTGSRPAAEDVVQDAMAGLCDVFGAVRVPEAYLRRSVVNRARSWHRAERRQRERAARLVGEWRPVVSDEDAGLLEAVMRLPYRQRVVIIARYWGGWSEAEIADALRCRPGTVKSLASRGLRKLQSEVER